IKSMLSTASTNQGFELACVFDEQGKILAYIRGNAYPQTTVDHLNCPEINEFRPNYDHLLSRALIVEPNLPQASGSVILVSTATSVQWYLGLWLIVAIFLSLLLPLLCWLLGLRLQRAILTPIRHIASTAQRVTLYKDYSLRVASS